jgi:hypothetical protein
MAAYVMFREAANSVIVDVQETLRLRTDVARRAGTRHPCRSCAAYTIPPHRQSCHEFGLERNNLRS